MKIISRRGLIRIPLTRPADTVRLVARHETERDGREPCGMNTTDWVEEKDEEETGREEDTSQVLF